VGYFLVLVAGNRGCAYFYCAPDGVNDLQKQFPACSYSLPSWDSANCPAPENGAGQLAGQRRENTAG
jgi:hypothetical protein